MVKWEGRILLMGRSNHSIKFFLLFHLGHVQTVDESEHKALVCVLSMRPDPNVMANRSSSEYDAFAVAGDGIPSPSLTGSMSCRHKHCHLQMAIPVPLMVLFDPSV